MMKDIDFCAREQIGNTSVVIHARQRLGHGRVRYLSPVSMKEPEFVDNLEHREFMVIDRKSAEKLMNTLWKCGIRPTPTCRVCEEPLGEFNPDGINECPLCGEKFYLPEIVSATDAQELTTIQDS